MSYFDELDLPSQYLKDVNNKVDYLYDATGYKWGKTSTSGGSTSDISYYGNFIYQDNTLDKVLTSEGYISIQPGNTSICHYYLKDHLGNTRMTFHYSGTTAVVDQEVEYYPFGSLFAENNLDKNTYLYNGKELNNEFFENYDYGRRFYDPTVPIFGQIDPKAEQYPWQSPYCYAANNPIRFIDFMGMNASPYYDKETGDFLGVDENGFKGQIKVTTKNAYNGAEKNEDGTVKSESIAENKDTKDIQDVNMSAESVSKVYTDIVDKMDDASKSDLYNGSISVFTNKWNGRGYSGYNDPEPASGCSEEDMANGSYKVTMNINSTEYLNTVENAQNTLGAHELRGHGIMGLKTGDGKHPDVYRYQMNHKTWKNTTPYHKNRIRKNYNNLKK